MQSAMRFDGLTDVPLPWERSQALSCAKFTWLTGENLDHEEESYWYAPYIGLVKWKSLTSDMESVISEFVPVNEKPNEINFACPNMKEWISEELPVEPPPPPQAPPETTYHDYPRGLDISHWQGDFNAETAIEEGANFVYLKATQGIGYADNKYLSNTQQALNFGMLVGSYHFFDASQDAAAQAEFFCQAVKDTGDQNLPPALDLETLAGVSITDHNAYRKAVLTLLAIVEDQLQTPVIYTNVSWYNTYLSTSDFDKYDLWIASWHNGTQPYLPTHNQDWLWWQFGLRDGYDYGVQSISVDVNYANFKDIAELYELFSNNWLEKPKPPPNTQYFPAPRRVDYNRVCHIIHQGMSEAEMNLIWKIAKTYQQTITFSYDDAGSTPVTEKVAILHGITPNAQPDYLEWFKTHYPATEIIFSTASEEIVKTTKSMDLNLNWEVGKEKDGLVARLRRTLVQLFSADRSN